MVGFKNEARNPDHSQVRRPITPAPTSFCRPGPYRGGVEAAFFDLDKTVIAKAAMMAFGPQLHKEGMINRWLVMRAVWGQLVFRYLGADEARMEKMRTTALRIAVGWDQAKVSALVDNALTEVIDPLVFDEALELIESHRDANRRVYLVSASPEEIVLPLARHLHADAAIATKARVDDRGRYTGEVEFYSAGENKVTAILAEADKHNIDLSASYAYSDSITDLPLLSAVGNPVAVNPDRALLREAKARGWTIMEFTHPRRLSNRQRARKATFVGLGVAGAAGAGLGWWWKQNRKRGWFKLG